MTAVGVHVCEGCGAMYDTIGGYLDCQDSHICGAEPPPEMVDAEGRTWTPGDCWCTLPPGHQGEHRCGPCTERHGAPGWADPTDGEQQR